MNKDQKSKNPDIKTEVTCAFNDISQNIKDSIFGLSSTVEMNHKEDEEVIDSDMLDRIDTTKINTHY
jgi:hypothetical protein